MIRLSLCQAEVCGVIARLLMTYTALRMYWLERLPPRRTHWLLAVLWGTGVYLLLYVL